MNLRHMKPGSAVEGLPVDITTLENWLWEAACSIRGPLDAPKYGKNAIAA